MQKRLFAVALSTVLGLSAYGAPHSLQPLIDAVVHQGPESTLPTHLSMVLGVSSTQQPALVKQAVMRTGSRVRTFNVSAANHDDVVLIDYDEQRRSSKVYLTSAGGVLRKAVAFQAGGAPTERAMAEAQSDFKKEIAFWTVPGGSGPPMR